MFLRNLRNLRTVRTFSFGIVPHKFQTRTGLVLSINTVRNMSSDNTDKSHAGRIGLQLNNATQNTERTASSQASSEDGTYTLYKDKVSEEEQRLGDLQAKALSFLAMVDEAALGPGQLEIHKAHVQVLKAGSMFYTDPATGYQVMSRLAHLNRGDCCGNACRHCPFGQKSAPEGLKKVYNSAFYE